MTRPHELVDIDADRHPSGAAALLVGIGGTVGTVGTAARYPLSEAIADIDGVPIGIAVVNATGALQRRHAGRVRLAVIAGWAITH